MNCLFANKILAREKTQKNQTVVIHFIPGAPGKVKIKAKFFIS